MLFDSLKIKQSFNEVEYHSIFENYLNKIKKDALKGGYLNSTYNITSLFQIKFA